MLRFRRPAGIDSHARAAPGVAVKRIVICADGTWAERDLLDKKTGKRRPTNVTKVARAILPRAQDGTDQVVFYHDGIGTKGVSDRLTGGAFGFGMESNIRELYRFLVYAYAPDDEIFLFGFSRGAFTVRSLAGFMHMVGLVEKDDDYFVPDLYACYEKRQGPGTAMWDKAFRKVQGTRQRVPIKFIGVWDTVGALGAPGVLGQVFGRKQYEYHDVSLHSEIQFAYQALAVDERRKPFSPSIWEKPAEWGGVLEQAWFAGAHGNVGGGNTPDGLANEALHWIVEKAAARGLEFGAKYLENFTPCFNSKLHDSMTLFFRPMGTYVRPVGANGAGEEEVHQAVIDRIRLPACNYRPTNVPANPSKVVTTTRIPRGKACADLK
jgi:uncharacterized protein (DUF2235 family)